MIQRVGIVSKPGRADIPPLLRQLTTWLDGRGIAVRADEATAAYIDLPGGVARARVAAGCDLVIVLGGTARCSRRRAASAMRKSPFWRSTWADWDS